MAEGLPAPTKKKNNRNKKVVFKKKWEMVKIPKTPNGLDIY